MNRSSTFPYASTQLTNNNPPPEIFYFKPRVETMDWREINQMDIDSLVEEGDMNSIQVTFYEYIYIYIECHPEFGFC